MIADHPYRSPPVAAPDPGDAERAKRAARMWKRYDRACVIHRWVLRTCKISPIVVAIGWPQFLLPLAVGLGYLWWCAWCYVRDSECPICNERIIGGPRVYSDLGAQLGDFPEECTHCATVIGAEPHPQPRRH